ncbi:MAG: DUF1028 domain-containing protein [Marinovum sp.]|jgi:uncharacterized Ntn-hydrolase superfamily protein|nr:DUF1028 domain-containing protein [Betaproteobacteria bacterium]MBT7908890.1 DUF1028 domain-containing protein [Marinovum sp.]
MTFSLVARCAETGMFGMAISSSSPAVAARCAYARSGVGAVASQNITDPSLGPKTLDKIAAGLSASSAVRDVISETEHKDYRQLLAIDVTGQTAIHSGGKVLGKWGEAQGRDVAAGGNLLKTAQVPAAIVAGFEDATGHLGDRLLAAMQAGLEAGGEEGPVHSAGLIIVDKVSWPVAELRCDWTENCPITEISKAWEIYKPQLDDYVRRALNPSDAPSYGVPGDL